MAEWIDWLPSVKVLQKAAIIDSDGNILVLRRDDTGPQGRAGKWDLCGGSMSPEDVAVDQKDPHQTAIRREIREETGLEVEEVEVVYIGSGAKHSESAGVVLILAIGYRCIVSTVRPEVTLTEHVESRWIAQEQALQLDFGDDGGFHKNTLERL